MSAENQPISVEYLKNMAPCDFLNYIKSRAEKGKTPVVGGEIMEDQRDISFDILPTDILDMFDNKTIRSLKSQINNNLSDCYDFKFIKKMKKSGGYTYLMTCKNKDGEKLSRIISARIYNTIAGMQSTPQTEAAQEQTEKVGAGMVKNDKLFDEETAILLQREKTLRESGNHDTTLYKKILKKLEKKGFKQNELGLRTFDIEDIDHDSLNEWLDQADSPFISDQTRGGFIGAIVQAIPAVIEGAIDLGNSLYDIFRKKHIVRMAEREIMNKFDTSDIPDEFKGENFKDGQGRVKLPENWMDMREEELKEYLLKGEKILKDNDKLEQIARDHIINQSKPGYLGTSAELEKADENDFYAKLLAKTIRLENYGVDVFVNDKLAMRRKVNKAKKNLEKLFPGMKFQDEKEKDDPKYDASRQTKQAEKDPRENADMREKINVPVSNKNIQNDPVVSNKNNMNIALDYNANAGYPDIASQKLQQGGAISYSKIRNPFSPY